MSERRIRLIYLMGAGRSGTTALASVLNAHDGIVSRGELHHLPKMRAAGEKCSCGLLICDCDAWSVVAALPEVERLADLGKLERHSWIPAWLFQRGRRKATEYICAQQAVLEHLFAGIEGRWLLDSSKYVARALLLRWIPGIDIRYVYLVRDARGVIHSFGKKVQTPRGGISASIYYLAINVAAEVARRTALRGNVLHVRYEDLVARPAEELARIGAFLGEDMTELTGRIERGETVPVGHIAGGNRLKSEGVLALRADHQWRDLMPRWRQWFYYLLCLPVQLANRYRL